MKISRLSGKQKNGALLVVAMVAGIGIYLGSVVNPPPSVTQESGVDSSVAQSPNGHTQVVSVNNQVIDTPAVGAQKAAVIAVQPAASANEPVKGWILGDVKAATPSITLNEKISQYEIVQVEHPQTYPAAGQQILLPMFNGKQVTVNVQSNSTMQNGDYTWSGHLDGFGTDYPVVMTYGEHSIFATITTPEGSYTMESINGSGWLYKNPSEFELSKPGTKDYLDVNE